jgi:hypothetical protein
MKVRRMRHTPHQEGGAVQHTRDGAWLTYIRLSRYL